MITLKGSFFRFVLFCFRYNLMFSLTGGGKYNFLGTKRWIEENMDHAGGSPALQTIKHMECVLYVLTGIQTPFN